MTTIKFAALLVAIVIGCASLGSAASYYINSVWYAAAEPIVYPCPYPGNAGVCSQNAEPTRSRSSRVAIRLAIHRPYPYSFPAAKKLRTRFPLP